MKVLKKILIVEDEKPIQTLLKYNLKQAGFETIIAGDGEEAIHMTAAYSPDLILLDIMLPKMDGIEVCKSLRESGSNIPVIMLTAKGDELEKVLGLEIGADDYMTKPFSPREVIARVNAVLRRSTDQKTVTLLKSGGLTIDLDRYQAYLNDSELDFTPKEFELLVYLIQNKNRALTRDQLLSAVWNYDFVGDTRIVDVHVSHLREKIEENTKKPLFIKTVRGIGYKFEEQKA